MSSNRIEKPGSSAPTVEGFILAGGRSRRMGRDKALIEFEGTTLLARAFATVSAVAVKTTVIARTPYPGFPVIADLRPDCGPLAGIETALSAAKTDAVIVLACDMPFVTVEFLEFLISKAGKDRAVIPVDAAGHPCGVCAVYGRDILPHVSNRLDADERRLDRLFSSIPVDFVQFADYAALPGAGDLLANLNAPDDLTAAHSSRP